MLLIDRWKARRVCQKYVRQLVKGIERRVAIEREIDQIDVSAVFLDYAIALGKEVRTLTQEEKRQALVNKALDAQKGLRLSWR